MKVFLKILSVLFFVISAFLMIGFLALFSSGEIYGGIIVTVMFCGFMFLAIFSLINSKSKKVEIENTNMFEIRSDMPSTVPDGEKNYDLFADVVDENVLSYQYENNLFVQNFEPIVGNGGESIKLIPEPDNEYDSETISVYLNGEKIAYIYKGKIRDMIHDWKKRDWKICAYINKYNVAEKTATYKIGFYKPLDVFENHEYKLTKISKKEDEFTGTSRFENLSCLSEGDMVSIEDMVVYDCADEIGELPKSAEDFIYSCEETVAIISEMDEDDDKISAKITVYKIK